MFGIGFVFGIILICIGVFFLYKNKKKSNEKYVWVGHGDDPFKKD